MTLSIDDVIDAEIVAILIGAGCLFVTFSFENDAEI
jgi:hypothetical protein